jgi:hypothetical protein
VFPFCACGGRLRLFLIRTLSFSPAPLLSDAELLDFLEDGVTDSVYACVDESVDVISFAWAPLSCVVFYEIFKSEFKFY